MLSLMLIFYSKSAEIFPMPSVKQTPSPEYLSSIVYSLMFLPEYVHDDEKLCPILAAFLAGFSISLKSPKNSNICRLLSSSNLF